MTPELAVWSGDTVRTDEDGFLYFIGRRDEMIKTSGYRVSPTEVEESRVRDRTRCRCGRGRRRASDARPGDRARRSACAGQERRRRSAARCVQARPARVHGAREASTGATSCREIPTASTIARVSQRNCATCSGGCADDDRPSRSTRRIRGSRSRTIASSSADAALPEIAAQVGRTPFYAYDRAVMTRKVQALREALPADIHLHYAMKANPMPAVVRHMVGLVDGLDVASVGEMEVALAAGAARGRHQLRRTRQDRAELERAAAAGITINVESEREVRVLAALALAAASVRASRCA